MACRHFRLAGCDDLLLRLSLSAILPFGRPDQGQTSGRFPVPGSSLNVSSMMFWRAASSTPRRLASMHGTTYCGGVARVRRFGLQDPCGWATLFWRRETRAMSVQNLTKAETCQVQSNRHPGTAEGFQSIFMHLRAEPAGMDLATLAAGRYAMEQTRMFSPLNRVPSLRGK